MGNERKRLDEAEIGRVLAGLPGWIRVGGAIEKRYVFADFHRTMDFVNAVAAIAHRLDHHPDLAVGYSRCTVRYTTHSGGGLTALDVEAARAVDALGS